MSDDPSEAGAAVAMVDYDRGWPALFEAEAAKIRAALGETALAVEHVGSTSVPGLAAKPVIDINLVVASSPTRPPIVRPWRPPATASPIASPTGSSTGCSRARRRP